MSEEKDIIPILDLENFVFTPPGPMGWAFEMTEKDVTNAKQGIQNIIEIEKMLSLDSLVELSSKKQQEYVAESKGINPFPKQNTLEETVQPNLNNTGEATQTEINNETDEVFQEDLDENVEEISHEVNSIVMEEEEEIDKIEESEEIEEPVVMENKVRIILPNTPLKGPWLANSKAGRFRK